MVWSRMVPSYDIGGQTTSWFDQGWSHHMILVVKPHHGLIKGGPIIWHWWSNHIMVWSGVVQSYDIGGQTASWFVQGWFHHMTLVVKRHRGLFKGGPIIWHWWSNHIMVLIKGCPILWHGWSNDIMVWSRVVQSYDIGGQTTSWFVQVWSHHMTLNQTHVLYVTHSLLASHGSTARNIQQVVSLLCIHVNSAFYPQWDGKWVMDHLVSSTRCSTVVCLPVALQAYSSISAVQPCTMTQSACVSVGSYVFTSVTDIAPVAWNSLNSWVAFSPHCLVSFHLCTE